ncbi:MAG TPA: SDR family oxidoreductase [Gammaproteobacteria bacterium]|nr:SDR family oxidoreductase [Gammaproteobacteria bacterium]
MAYVLIIGAKSDIAMALARKYAESGHDLYLAARKPEELRGFANDLKIRSQKDIRLLALDILDFSSHDGFYRSLDQKPSGVISVVGYLGEQVKAQSEFTEAHRIIDTNFTGVVSLLNIVADDFEARKEGFIVGISSVAGDRGRKSNYIYGSAKAAFTTYLSGLRNRLHDAGINVLTVKPGFVATKMTEGMDLPGALTAQADEVAKDIFEAQQKKQDVIYSKWMWRWIMSIINNIPEWIFKKTSI